MKKIIIFALALLALLATPLARAWTYSDGDVLLIFRESGFNDVEFDIGNISQFLGQTNGYTATVANWNLSTVTNTFPSLSGVSVILLATASDTNASPTAWLSGSEPNTTAYNVNNTLWSVIDAVGQKPIALHVPTNNATSYSINPFGTYANASYDYIVSSGHYTSIPDLGGNVPFTVEQIIPGSFDFWATQPVGGVNPTPDELIGTFSITANGVLTFVAGPPPSTITQITRSSGSGNVTNTLTFTTRVGVNYSLISTNTLVPSAGIWPVVGGPIVGDGKNDSITNTSTGNQEFYRVISP